MNGVDDNFILTALSGPPNTITSLGNALLNEDEIRSWNPNWTVFGQYLDKIQSTNRANQYLHALLCIEMTPVPQSIVARILALDSGAIDERSLLIAFKNPNLTRDVFLQLLDHIIQFEMTDLLKYTSTKLLHECAKANCIEGARAVIDYFPTSLDCTDVMGLRPLHGAFSYQNRSFKRSEMVNLLVKEGKKNFLGGEQGCGGVFLERSVNGSGGSPFELSLYYLRQANARGGDCEDQWRCLTACYEASKSTLKDFQLVNYIITLHVDMENMIRKVVERYSINLNDWDEKGMTPLTVAIQKGKASYIRTLLSIQNCALEQIPRCELNGKSYNNRLPLHFAVDLGITWSDGLKEITESNKAAVSILDRDTGLYPFMIAAQHKNNPLHDTYYLLRQNPSVLDHIMKHKIHQRPSLFGIHYATHILFGAALGTVIYHILSACVSAYMQEQDIVLLIPKIMFR
mmetsp:Transcript_24862/g.37153  ORF Transcript_24862/g.37153 Transcript_24862/m.37153 type:complete len:458 (-) Transcript_24862:68-1441(-)